MIFENEIINPAEVKNRSEKIIINAGGVILDWLPTLELPKPRIIDEVINRALVLNAIYQLTLNAPKKYITNWIEQNCLNPALTTPEISLLISPNDLSENEQYELYWSLESLWAIAWATNLIEDLSFNQQVGDELAGLSPNLQLNENGQIYKDNMRLRSIKSIYEMLDLYYRVHWWVQSSQRENIPVDNVSLEVIVARRKALEWIANSSLSWDEIDLNV